MADEVPPIIRILEEREVEFYGDRVLALLVEEEGELRVYVPVRPLTDTLGLDWSAQSRRIQRNRILDEAQRSLPVKGRGSNPQEMTCLQLDHLDGWLMGVSLERVKTELQERVYLYQKQCYRELARAFQHDQPALPSAETSAAIQTLEQMRDLHLAYARQMEEAIAIRQRTEDAHARIDKAGHLVKDLDRRVARIEQALHPEHVLTDEQAEALQSAVTMLAMLLARADGKNHFPAVWEEIRRRGFAPDYKHIKQARYPGIMTFLEQWYTATLAGQAAGGTPTPPPE